MSATNRPPALRFTQAWLLRNGQGLQLLSPAAFELLRQRFAARRRALWVFVGPVLVGPIAVLGLAAVTMTGLEDDGVTRWSARAGWLLVTAVGALVGGELLRVLAETRSDRVLAGSLTRRVTRSEPVRLVDVAGRRVLVALAVTAAAGVALGGLTWTAAPGWPAVTVTACLVLAFAGCGTGIARALHRPVIAYDPVTLTLDERLRRTDVVNGALVLVASLVLVQLVRPFVLTPSTPPLVWAVWFVVVPAVMLLQIALTMPPRWPGAPYGQGEAARAAYSAPPAVPR